jgi:hypothetical protein
VISGGFEPLDASQKIDRDLGDLVRGGAAKSGAAQTGKGSHGGAAEDPDLARVIEAWPRLPAHIRAAVLALLEGA